MSNTIRVCANCGSAHLQLASHREGFETLYFCSLKCRDTLLEKMQGEKSNEEKTSILPEVRIFTARKKKQGITVVRGENGFYGNGSEKQD